MSAEEGEPGISAGRPTGTAQVCVCSAFTVVDVWTISGEDGEPSSPGEDSVPDPEEREDEGSNLVDSRPSVLLREPTLLDLPRELVEAEVFHSYTYTGVLYLRGFCSTYTRFNSLYHKYLDVSRNFIIFAQLPTLQSATWQPLHAGGHRQ